MYLARMEKKSEKNLNSYSNVQMCFSYYFNVITSFNLLPLLQLVLKYA